MAEIKDIEKLLNSEVKKVTSSGLEWMNYLNTVARQYRYSFGNTLLIHAQLPEATACGTQELWNKQFNRIVKNGSRGISIINSDDNTGQRSVSYIYDVSQTYKADENSGDPALWELSAENRADAARYINQAYDFGFRDDSDLYFALTNAAVQDTMDIIDDSVDKIYDALPDNSPLSKSKGALRTAYKNLVSYSAFYICAQRCGLENPLTFIGSNAFNNITEFSDYDTLSFFGEDIITISDNILTDLGKFVKGLNAQKSQNMIENQNETEYNQSEQNVLQQEDLNEPEETEETNFAEERRGEDEDRLHREGREALSGAEREGRERGPGEVREVQQNEEEIPRGVPAGDLRSNADVRETERTSGGSPGGDAGPGERDREAAEEAVQGSNGGPERGPGEMGGTGQQLDRNGGGDRTAGDGLRLDNNIETEQTQNEAEADMVSALNLPETGNSDQQYREIEELAAAPWADNTDFTFPTDVIDAVLRSGGGESDSLQRIVYNFMSIQTDDDYASFLRDEYGEGGKGLIINGTKYAVWFNKEGMTIAEGDSALRPGMHNSCFLSWNDASARVHQLLLSGEYAPQNILDDARPNALQEHANTLAYFERDMNDDARKRAFADDMPDHFVWPEITDKLSELLSDPVWLSDLNARLAELADAYKVSPKEIMQRTNGPYSPDKMADYFKKFALPVMSFHARNDINDDVKQFITQDNIDAYLLRGGNYENGQLSIYSYFLRNTDKVDRAGFLKDQYGTGGRAPALEGLWASDASHDAKGLKLSIGEIGEPEDSVLLSWPQVAARYDNLINEGRFPTQEAVRQIPQYELNHMAASVISFYSYLPRDIEKPYEGNSAENYWGTINNIADLINDDDEFEKLIGKMSEDIKLLSPDDRGYELCNSTLLNLQGYADGSYSLFPNTSQQETPDESEPTQTASPSRMNFVEHANVPEPEADFGEDQQISLFDLFNMDPDDEEEDLHPVDDFAQEISDEEIMRDFDQHLAEAGFSMDDFSPEQTDALFDAELRNALSDAMINPDLTPEEMNEREEETSANVQSGHGEDQGNNTDGNEPGGEAHNPADSQEETQDLPLNHVIFFDGRNWRIDNVDYENNRVWLVDVESENAYPVGRNETVDTVRYVLSQENQLSNEADEHVQKESEDSDFGAADAGEGAGDHSPESDELAEGTFVNIDGKTFSIEAVDYDSGMVLLLDLSVLEQSGQSIERIETIDNVLLAARKQPEDLREQTALPNSDDDGTPDNNAGSSSLGGDETPHEENTQPQNPNGQTEETPEIKNENSMDSPAADENNQQNTAPETERINFHITDDDLGEGGAKAKFRANIDAITLLKDLQETGRNATEDEQKILSGYVGWGGLPQAFDDQNAGWSSEYQELKSLLTDDEYRDARESTLTAFYTPPVVIKAMYQVLENMGLSSGNILEPSCGVGNFMGLVPNTLENNINMYGVELDEISGSIAKQLYQKNNITIDGFENTDFPDNFFDCVIGNVPFGAYKVADKRYDRYNMQIHDYFIAKSLDLVRPGGVVAVITASGTMDKKDESVRKYIAQRADLLGAIRLPRTAFSRNANTQTLTDILFLQKRELVRSDMPSWVGLDTTADGFTLNSYFVENPDMIMGDLSMTSTRYGRDELTVLPHEDISLETQLASAGANIHGIINDYIPEDMQEQNENNTIPADPAVKNFSFTEVDGDIYFRENSVMIRQDNLGEKRKARVSGMIELRDTVRELLDCQEIGGTDIKVSELQLKLNREYDDFTSKNGLINSKANQIAFGEDDSYPLLSALEEVNDDGKLIRKADIFTKRTIRRPEPITSSDSPADALAVSIGERARVDLDFMADLLGTPGDYGKIVNDLQGAIFKDPDRAVEGDFTSGWVTSDEYLSGNVRQKLRTATAASENDSLYMVNVEYLKKVQPKDLTASEIEVRLGAPWVPVKYIQQFAEEFFNMDEYARQHVQVHFEPAIGQWEIDSKPWGNFNPLARSTYGTKRRNGYQLLEYNLNLKDAKVYDAYDEDGKRKQKLNKKETALAQQKQELIRQGFKDWIFKDIDRREDLCNIYNEKFNSTRPREYNGDYLRLSGMSPSIELMKHQKDAIAHVLYGNNTLLAHCVGAGKTFEMAASAMESIRLGLASKCLFVVPNHLTQQWGSEFLRLYPNAKILVATEKDFEKKNRRKFCSRIATGQYDAVIIGHTQLMKIPLSPERQAAEIQDQIDEIESCLTAARNGKGAEISIKQMERTRKNLQTTLAKLNDQTGKDDVVRFEQLGVDRLYVDESQYYKNLYIYTKMSNIAGVQTTSAKKSNDLYMKCQYMDELTGGKGTVFATGTPVTNSMTELYTLMRYLQNDRLKELGLSFFDNWAASFGETTTSIELSPEGTGYRAKTRFARFYNLPELMSVFKECADIKTSDMLDLPVPNVRYIDETTKPTEFQKSSVQAFSERAEKVHNNMVDPKDDNMLKITSDGRKLALDQRLMEDFAPDEMDSKVNQCVNNVYRIWKDTADKGSTQLIFCDLSTPNPDTFNIYDDVKNKLIDMGVPKDEIAFIHDAHTDEQKKSLFKSVRTSEVRILMGSTPKMGTGTNVQDHLIALHHLDVPWRPSDMEQREGRILRQGNENDEVEIYRYVTEGTFDAYSWQTLETKQKFISQIMTSKEPVRSAQDVDDTALSYAEIKALATDNPYIKEKMELETDVSTLKMMKSNWTDQHYQLESDLARLYPQQISNLEARLDGMKKDCESLDLSLLTKDNFSMTVNGKTYTKRADAGDAILDSMHDITKNKNYYCAERIGDYCGFTMTLKYDVVKRDFILTLQNNTTYQVTLGKDSEGNITRINNGLENIGTKYIPEAEAKLKTLNEEKANAEIAVKVPFGQEEELKQKSARLDELNAKLNLDMKADPNETVGLDDEDREIIQTSDRNDRYYDDANVENEDMSYGPTVNNGHYDHIKFNPSFNGRPDTSGQSHETIPFRTAHGSSAGTTADPAMPASRDDIPYYSAENKQQDNSTPHLI